MHPSTAEIYTLSLHDALPIWAARPPAGEAHREFRRSGDLPSLLRRRGRHSGEHHDLFPLADRKSTRLNSSHTVISYAVFCLKKKKKNNDTLTIRCTQPQKSL